MTIKINGIPASPGIAVAKVFLFEEKEINVIRNKIKKEEVENEIKLFEKSLLDSIEDLNKLKHIALERLGQEKAAIFDAHIEIINDPSIKNEVLEIIKTDFVNAAFAFEKVMNKYINIFSSMDDEYFKERANDIKDVGDRILKHLLGIEIVDLASIDKPTIIVAHDLTPSQTIQLDPKYVKGFICEMGGATSHAAILARSLSIPAVLGAKDILEKANHLEDIVIDGSDGNVIIKPSDDEIKLWEKKVEDYNKSLLALEKFKTLKTISKDNKHFEIEANIGSPKDVKKALENGAEGIGLFRTEFLYMDNDHFPTEDEQYEEYKTVLEQIKDNKVIIRTLDIGGDKHLKYFNFPKELNPFLGNRAIRFCLDHEEIFITQIRALLRASIHGNLWIMFPMIATLNEFRQAKNILLEQEKLLKKEGYEISNNFKVGMMIEIPSSAILADQFAKEVDFFSIGTNDLIQYTMASDRMNESVAYLYQPLNPAILRIIKMAIDGAHSQGKPIGMCGEVAGHPKAIELLVGMGLDMFSMSSPSIPKSREIISKVDSTEAKKLVDKAISFKTVEEVREIIKK